MLPKANSATLLSRTVREGQSCIKWRWRATSFMTNFYLIYFLDGKCSKGNPRSLFVFHDS